MHRIHTTEVTRALDALVQQQEGNNGGGSSRDNEAAQAALGKLLGKVRA
jgi:hypothetical protein